MAHRLRDSIALVFGLALCAKIPIVAAEGALEEVVVTAQKREQNLQDVPVAVTALSGEALRNSGVQDLFELAGITPSLAITSAPTPLPSAMPTSGLRCRRRASPRAALR